MSNDCPPAGTIVAVQKGSDWDQVTHNYVSTGEGYIRLLPMGRDKGIMTFEPEGDVVAPEVVHDGYTTGSILYAAPTPGQRVENPYTLIGLPDGTKLISPTGKPMVKKGFGIVQDGRSFEMKHVSDLCRLAESSMAASAGEGPIKGGDIVDRLRRLMAREGIHDDQIANGVGFTPDSQARASLALGIDVADFPLLQSALLQRIRDERKRYDTMVEDFQSDGAAKPYSMEPDALGNVTVRCNASGKHAYLTGTKASALLNRLKGASEEQKQQLLGGYKNLMVEASFLPRVDRAMTQDQEDQAVERPHWQAHKETGFYGRQGAGCIIVAQRTGRVLLSHRSGSVEEPHTWGNWGGAVDEGVDPQEHAEREVYQECGYQGKVLAIVPLYQFQKGSFRYSNFMIVVPDEFTPDLNWESQGFRWCRYGEWPTPLHFGLVALFNDGPSAALIKRVCSAALDPTVHESLDEEEEEHDHDSHFHDTDDHVEPAILDEENDFEGELAQTGGSYNFPWSVGGKQGTATARYSSKGGQLHVTLMSVRDEKGKPVKPSDQMGDALQKQAIRFIGKE